jgi:ribosomal protein S18 acetylase RimI-like enzyme
MNGTELHFSIRPAAPPDATVLAELRCALFTELGHEFPTTRRAAFQRDCATAFREGLDGGICHAWLACTANGEAIGCVALLLYPRLPSPDSPAQTEGYLLSVYTVPACRGRGVAASLVAAAIARARALGLGRIRLHTTPAGEPVYAAAGFRLRQDEMELRL